jgi:hypothetical protein
MARIKYNSPVTDGGNFIWTIVNHTIVAWQAAQRVRAEMDSLVGSPADYTKLEAPFGLAVGTGQAFYNTIVALKVNLDTACVSIGDMDKIA